MSTKGGGQQYLSLGSLKTVPEQKGINIFLRAWLCPSSVGRFLSCLCCKAATTLAVLQWTCKESPSNPPLHTMLIPVSFHEPLASSSWDTVVYQDRSNCCHGVLCVSPHVKYLAILTSFTSLCTRQHCHPQQVSVEITMAQKPKTVLL